MTGGIRLDGRGLHSGRRCTVELRLHVGTVGFATDAGFAPIDSGRIVSADRGVRVRYESIGLEVELVEHLAGALAGLGVRRDLSIVVSGGEIPLLDGGAARVTAALCALKLAPSPPTLRIQRPASLTFGATAYRFTPSDDVRITVTTDFIEVGRETAVWDGSPGQFRREIAGARTFGFLREAAAVRRSGRARWVDPTAVMVLDDSGNVQPPGRPRTVNELARHKLLDLLGDFYLLGGPPLGVIAAHRPGHSLNHRAFRQALDAGILVPHEPGGETPPHRQRPGESAARCKARQ